MRSKLNKPAKRIVKVLFLALVVHLFVLPQIGGVRNSLSVLGTINPLLVLTALVLEFLAFLAYARLTQMLLSENSRPGVGVAFGTVMASTGVNHVVPGGAATTAAVNYRLLGRAGVPRDELGFALGTQAIGSAVVLNVILWIALVVSIPTSGFHRTYGTAAAVGAVIIAMASAAVVAMLRRPDRFARRIARLIRFVPGLGEDGVRNNMLTVSGHLSVLAKDRERVRMLVVLASANWLFDAAALWVTIAAFGPRPTVVGVLVAYGLANVMAAIPISPGGLGVIEAILIPSLVGFGTPRSQASIAVVVYRLVNFWLPIPVGAVSYVAVERATASVSDIGFTGEINEQVQHIKELLTHEDPHTGGDR